MFYILYGEDDFTRTQEVSKLCAQVADDGMGDLNITQLDGRKLSFVDLLNVCNTIPFLTDRRLVVVNGLLARVGGRTASRSSRSRKKSSPPSSSDVAFVEKLIAYLPQVPDTTRLLFVESKNLPRNHAVLKAASEMEHGYVRRFDLPRPADLPRWVTRRTESKGAQIEPRAADALAQMVGGDLWTLDRDLEKLAAYANYERSITLEDVRALVSAAQEADIFAFVDTLGLRRGRQALEQLHHLVANGAADLYLLTMVARQVRLILAAKELSEREKLGRTEIQKALRVSHSFIVDKLLGQARQFQMDELVLLMERILETDEGIKTGRVDGTLALELLTLEVCHKREPAIGSLS